MISSDRHDSRRLQSVTVEVIKLDDVLDATVASHPSLPLTYWKSDIEGFEPRMFRGAFRFFAHYQPRELAFEILGKVFFYIL